MIFNLIRLFRTYWCLLATIIEKKSVSMSIMLHRRNTGPNLFEMDKMFALVKNFIHANDVSWIRSCGRRITLFFLQKSSIQANKLTEKSTWDHLKTICLLLPNFGANQKGVSGKWSKKETMCRNRVFKLLNWRNKVHETIRGRSSLMGNRRPECFLWGPKKSCLKNVGCQIFSDFFVGSQILTLIFCKIQFFYCKMLYRRQFRKSGPYKKKKADKPRTGFLPLVKTN